MSDLPGYDAWKQNADADAPDRDRHFGHGLPYRCIDCAWTGHGAEATDHHRESRHHRIVFRNYPTIAVMFSCCEPIAQPHEELTEEKVTL
jgi:hypothetical protein